MTSPRPNDPQNVRPIDTSAADRRLAERAARAASEHLGPWSEEQVAAYVQAWISAPPAIYRGKTMIPVDVHGLGVAAALAIGGGR